MQQAYCFRLFRQAIWRVFAFGHGGNGGRGQSRSDPYEDPYGTAVGRIVKVLDELKKQGFGGNISVEYEYNWEHSVPEIKQCIDFVKAHGR